MPSNDQRSTVEPAHQAIKGSEIELKSMIDLIPEQAWLSRIDGYNLDCNQPWLDYFGFTKERARGCSYRGAIHPDDLDSFVSQWSERSLLGERFEAELRLRRADGAYRWFVFRALPIRDEAGQIVKWFGTNTDIDDQKTAIALLAGENRILERVVSGVALPVILEDLCRLFDRTTGCSMASVLLVDSDDRLRPGAAPNLPRDLCGCFDGVKIGPNVGSCGSAAYRREQVIVEDIETSPLWEAFRAVARRHGLRAGWSTPIFSSERRLLGVFGIHWYKPHIPTSVHFRMIDSMTHLAAVAIERQQSQEALRASEKLARGQADTLTRTLDQIARESSFDRIAEYALQTLTNQFAASGSSVFLWNAETDRMDLGFVFEEGRLKSISDPKVSAIYPSLFWNDIPQWKEAFGRGKPVILTDIRQGSGAPWRAHLLQHGIITVLIVPAFVAGKPAAAFGIRFTQERQFRPEELELAQALANQAMLAMQLTRLSEERRRLAVIGERNRLAREVHDTLAQGFTGVIVQLEAAGEAIAHGLEEKVPEHLARASALARESLQEARRSVKALRPQALAQSGLTAALKELLAKMTDGATLKATLDVEGELPHLPEEWEINLVRIVQETLTNALRHSRATEFHADLAFDLQSVKLELRDNGAGFDPETKSEGLGLQGITERVAAMGGKLSLSTIVGRGTSFSIILPLESEPTNHETND